MLEQHSQLLMKRYFTPELLCFQLTRLFCDTAVLRREPMSPLIPMCIYLRLSSPEKRRLTQRMAKRSPIPLLEVEQKYVSRLNEDF